MTQTLKPVSDVRIKVVIEAEYTVPATSLLNAYGSTDPEDVAMVDAVLWSDPSEVSTLIYGLSEQAETGSMNAFVSTTVTAEAIK